MINKDYKKLTTDLISWLSDWFDKNGKDCNAVIGISGGKDSSVVAALCVAALGRDRVIGVMMPNGEQSDINYSLDLINFLGIKSYTINIKDSYESILNQMKIQDISIDKLTTTNLPARLRVSVLYAVSQSLNGRVVGCSNASENYIGYATAHDLSFCNDVSPIANLLVGDVKEVGKELGLPDKFINKIPSDGLCGKTDEDNLGFTYDTLDKYISSGICEDENIKLKIETMHQRSRYKFRNSESFEV